MVALDDPLPVTDGTKTLLDLAAAGTLTLARTGSYRERPDAAPRAVWWALTVPDGTRYEISGSSFRALRRLGVPVTPQWRTGGPGPETMADQQIES